MTPISYGDNREKRSFIVSKTKVMPKVIHSNCGQKSTRAFEIV